MPEAFARRVFLDVRRRCSGGSGRWGALLRGSKGGAERQACLAVGGGHGAEQGAPPPRSIRWQNVRVAETKPPDRLATAGRVAAAAAFSRRGCAGPNRDQGRTTIWFLTDITPLTFMA